MDTVNALSKSSLCYYYGLCHLYRALTRGHSLYISTYSATLSFSYADSRAPLDGNLNLALAVKDLEGQADGASPPRSSISLGQKAPVEEAAVVKGLAVSLGHAGILAGSNVGGEELVEDVGAAADAALETAVEANGDSLGSNVVDSVGGGLGDGVGDRRESLLVILSEVFIGIVWMEQSPDGTYGVNHNVGSSGEGDGLLDRRRRGGNEARASTAHTRDGIRGREPRRVSGGVITLVSGIMLGSVLGDCLSSSRNSLVPGSKLEICS